MTIYQLLRSEPLLFTALVGICGLMVGSFLNVVIHRLPVMLMRAWQREARTILELAQPDVARFNLALPASHCPICNHQIRPWENIPVLSWIALRGKCSSCKGPISPRYPLVELSSALLSAGVAWHFGYGLPTLFALLLVWGAIALAMIDIDEMLLPDAIVLPGIWIGLFAGYLGVFVSLDASLLGAIVGYLALATAACTAQLVTGREGIGMGDAKLLAMLGAWAGWQAIPLVILIASAAAVVVGLLVVRRKGEPYPFGPMLLVAGIVALLWGRDLYGFYGQTFDVDFIRFLYG
ncbi:prepilin peptidase [Pseudomonas guariconensis]|uniref:prepilin peptidase n=1 Tax=Pseudomonas guariconensis TaxID=1288410 RepID=UPI003905C0D3